MNSRLNGIYAMYFTGQNGWGHGVLVVKDGAITGADSREVLFDGTCKDMGNDGVAMSMTMSIPAGTWLVNGDVVREPVTRQINDVVLPANFANGNTIHVPTPTGPVNVRFKRLRDAW